MAISRCGSLHAACCHKQDAQACQHCAPSASADSQQRLGSCSFLQQPTCTSILPRCLAKDFDGFADDDEEIEKEGQAHVFSFYQELSEQQRDQLEHDFNAVDDCFFHDKFLFKARAAIRDRQTFAHWPPTLMDWQRKKLPQLEPGANLTLLQNVDEHRRALWHGMGLDMYSKRQVGICILHGGEDSDLGEGEPKGVLDLGLLSRKSILQLFLERVKRLQSLVSRRTHETVEIPVYLMCKAENMYLLEDYLAENSYFGLFAENVFLFPQGNAPLLDTKGRLMMREKHRIYQEASGNGYLLKALESDGLAADLKSRCLSILYVCSIDNALTKIGDPTFLGFCKQCDAEAGVKLFHKESADEPFGLFLSTRQPSDIGDDGFYTTLRVHAAIVEHREMSEEDLSKTVDYKSRALLYDCANFSQYCFKLHWLMRNGDHRRHAAGHHHRWHPISKSRRRLNLHTGEAMIPLNGDGNAWRMEQYLSDCLERSDKVVGLKMSRSEFAWLKKPKGQHSPQSVCLAMSLLHQSWICKGGGTFSGNKMASDRDDAKCEISPLVSYDGEDLDGQFWLPIELPFYLPSQQEDSESFAAELKSKNQGSIHFLNWESDFAKRNLNEELQFALNKVFDTTSMGPDYTGEKAERSENLPPTPDHEVELEEELIRRSSDLLERRRTITNERLPYQGNDMTVADWILGPRLKQPTAEALIGSPRLVERRKDFLSSRKSEFKVDRFQLAKDSARQSSARGENSARGVTSSPRGSFCSGSPRGSVLASGLLKQRLSFRCVPPNMQGLEISEYGQRLRSPEQTSNWWHGQPKDSRPPAAPVEVPSGLECVIC